MRFIFNAFSLAESENNQRERNNNVILNITLITLYIFCYINCVTSVVFLSSNSVKM